MSVNQVNESRPHQKRTNEDILSGCSWETMYRYSLKPKLSFTISSKTLLELYCPLCVSGDSGLQMTHKPFGHKQRLVSILINNFQTNFTSSSEVRLSASDAVKDRTEPGRESPGENENNGRASRLEVFLYCADFQGCFCKVGTEVSTNQIPKFGRD